MKFVKVAYAMNQTYYVEDFAIEQMVKSIFAGTPGIKLNDVEVKINVNNNGYELNIKAKKDFQKSYYDLTKYLEHEIETQSLNLVNTKPENIAIAMEENNE